MTRRILLMLLAMLLVMPGCRAASVTPDNVPLTITKQDGQIITLQVELALTPEQQEKGLMFRTSLPDDGGMLFVFDGEDEHRFWMRNTLIPLDMIFIRADGTIHSIHANAIPHDETSISSQGPVHSVLEISGGQAQTLNIVKGDRVSFRLASPLPSGERPGEGAPPGENPHSGL